MEFVKVGKNYLIKNSGGKIVSEKEMLELKNKELVYKDITSSECQGKTTQILSKNKERIEKIMTEEQPVEMHIKFEELDAKTITDQVKDITIQENEEHKVVEIQKPKRKRKANAKKVEAKDDIIEETDQSI